MASPQLSRTAASAIACILIAACSLDNRQLQLANAGTGGAESGAGGQAVDGGAGQAAGSTNQADAGEGGSTDLPIPVADGCADLDVDKIADCTETNVQNSDFKSDVSNWRPDMDTTIDWDASNAAGDLPSGSALIVSPGVIDATATGVALRAAQQCIPMSGTKLVIVYANALVDPGQDEQGRAEVDVAFFDSEDCTGALTTTFSTPQPLDGKSGSWLTLKAGSVSAETTRSAQIKLALLKPFRAPSFQARFDNVLVRVESAQP
jgi:hypothetical protein